MALTCHTSSSVSPPSHLSASPFQGSLAPSPRLGRSLWHAALATPCNPWQVGIIGLFLPSESSGGTDTPMSPLSPSIPVVSHSTWQRTGVLPSGCFSERANAGRVRNAPRSLCISEPRIRTGNSQTYTMENMENTFYKVNLNWIQRNAD